MINWIKTRISHKFGHFSRERLKAFLKKNGLAFVIIFIGWEIVEDLRAAGVRFQVNRTVGKINVPGVGSRGRMLTNLQRAGYIDEVGSDLHRATPEGRPYAMPSTPRPAPS